ncbi:MAG: PEPxxWA-CTERM sorting domain-containing protein [Methylobacteriaceae bacterium]|nr:PEPxxWA-CTERM sorting domain-containing protein [Methylobacteriaceae bacterium]
MRVTGVAVAAALSCASAANAAILYQNDFQSGVAGPAIAGTTTILPGSGGQLFLGPLAAGAASTLTVNALGASTVTLSFDLYTLHSLDGNGVHCCGPDFFKVTIGGVTVLNETFANDPSWLQSYGGPGATGGTGSDGSLTGSLGYQFFGPDHTYHLTFTGPVVGPNVVITFHGNSDQGWSDEGFGVDNIKVTGIAAGVPEPSTWAMMLIGFAGLGLMSQRRRRRLARA